MRRSRDSNQRSRDSAHRLHSPERSGQDSGGSSNPAARAYNQELDALTGVHTTAARNARGKSQAYIFTYVYTAVYTAQPLVVFDPGQSQRSKRFGCRKTAQRSAAHAKTWRTSARRARVSRKLLLWAGWRLNGGCADRLPSRKLEKKKKNFCSESNIALLAAKGGGRDTCMRILECMCECMCEEESVFQFCSSQSAAERIEYYPLLHFYNSQYS